MRVDAYMHQEEITSGFGNYFVSPMKGADIFVGKN